MNALAAHWSVWREAVADDKRRRGSLLRTDETAFLPAALEIIEKPVSPTGRATTWLLLIGLLLTILWLVFGHIDVVASAPGKLVPADKVKLIQPADAGVVRAIHVRDGQRVRAGEALVDLDPTISGADAEQAKRALETAELDAARGHALLSALDGHGLYLNLPATTAPEIVRNQRALAQSQLADIQASASMHASDRQAAIAARTEAQVQAAKLTETLPLLDEQIAANEALLAKGYVSKLKVIEMRRQRLSSARDRDIALATAGKATAQLAGAGSGEIQSREQARSRVLGDIAKAESDARLRREELTKASQKSSLQRITSPVDGIVTQLAINTIGGVVEPGKPIMIIVPSGGMLVADVKIPNREMGFVHVGQDVALKLEAYPFTRYGTLIGTVDVISPDAVEDEKLGLIYPAIVSLKAGRGRSGTIVPGPGMQTTADIRTGSRSLMSYLWGPLKEAATTAARER